MNIPSDLMILGIVIIALLLIFITGAEATIPAFVRTEFDSIGWHYLGKLQSEGGISQEDKNQIVAELQGLGFTNISISAPENVAWGQEAQIRITADYIATQTTASLNKESKTLSATFDEKTIVMTLNR